MGEFGGWGGERERQGPARQRLALRWITIAPLSRFVVGPNSHCLTCHV